MTDETTTTDAPSVHVLMGRILADLPAIGKNQRNSEQGFMFRGMDDVLDALNPIMAKHGVFCVPDVCERVAAQRTTRGGATMYEVNLHVRFTFYGPNGDSVRGSGWGEGTDMGDKATNKAMTNAFKYVLFQTFAISTREAAETDNDRHTPEETIPNSMQCRECGQWIEGAKSDVEVMRAHVVEAHAFVRLENGKVEHPDAYAKRMSAEGAKTPPPDEAQASPAPPSTGGENPVDDTATEDPYAYVETLKGADLMAEAERVGVPKGGTVAAVKDRIRVALSEADAGPGDDPDAGTDPAPQDAADAFTGPDPSDTPADDDGAVQGGDFACPNCDREYPTEELYHAHWYATHDDDGSAEDVGATDQTPDDAETARETVKARVATLAGEHARAYGKYRREAKLPRPDEMTVEQCDALISFLDELARA